MTLSTSLFPQGLRRDFGGKGVSTGLPGVGRGLGSLSENHCHVQLFCDPMDYSLPASSCPWNSAGRSTGVGSHSLLQGIFLTQGLNPGLPHCRRYLRLASYYWGLKAPPTPILGTVPWGQWDQYCQPFALIEGCGTKLLSFYFKRNQTNFLKKRRWANSSKCNMKAQLHSATSAQYLPEWVFLEEPRRILD